MTDFDLPLPLLEDVWTIPVDGDVMRELHRNQHARQRSGDRRLGHWWLVWPCRPQQPVHLSESDAREFLDEQHAEVSHFRVHFCRSSSRACGSRDRPRGLESPDDGVGGSPGGLRDAPHRPRNLCHREKRRRFAGDPRCKHVGNAVAASPRLADVRMRTKCPSPFSGQLVGGKPEAEQGRST